MELTFYLTICILLLITLHFLGPIENIQEDAGQVKSITKEIGQDVRQIKDDVTKIKGWYSFFSFFDVETLTKLWTKMPRSSKYDIAGGHRSKIVSWSIKKKKIIALTSFFLVMIADFSTLKLNLQITL